MRQWITKTGSAKDPGRRKRWLAVAGACVIAWAAAAPSDAYLRATDEVGTLQDRPVLLLDVDLSLGGGVSEQWRHMYSVMASAARSLCRQRALARIAADGGMTTTAWKAATWRGITVSDVDADRYTVARPSSGLESEAARQAAAHALHVERYRQRLETEADRAIGNTFSFNVVAPGATVAAEPRMPFLASSCLGGNITRDQIEQYAVVPLYRIRADTVTAICSQLEGPDVASLALARESRVANVPPAQLQAEVAAFRGVPTHEELEAAALARYGVATPQALFKARVELDVARAQIKHAESVARIQNASDGRCSLELPPPPQVVVESRPAPSTDGARSDAIEVFYFGAFRCPDCPGGWAVLKRLEGRYGEGLRGQLRHHFPEASLPRFLDATAVECAAAQGRMWEAGEWILAGHSRDELVVGLGLDGPTFERCAAAPATAVAVLEDTGEALRLGFVGAVPSWVVAGKVRRGVQGELDLRRAIDAQARWDRDRQAQAVRNGALAAQAAAARTTDAKAKASRDARFGRPSPRSATEARSDTVRTR